MTDFRSVSGIARYRPVKIGWVVKHGDLDALRRAIKLTCTLWGGKFNPIIPADTLVAERLVDVFRPDVLIDGGGGEGFCNAHRHLAQSNNELFGSEEGYIWPVYADIYGPVEKLAADISQRRRVVSVSCAANDPLADVFLVRFGGYDDRSTKIAYGSYVISRLSIMPVSMPLDGQIPQSLDDEFTPVSLTSLGLAPDESFAFYDDVLRGTYWGDAGCFDHVCDYWNLRACGFDLAFYDPSYGYRLKDDVARRCIVRSPAHGIFGTPRVFARQKVSRADLAALGVKSASIRVNDGFWKRLVPRPFTTTGWLPVLATEESRDGKSDLAVQLPDSPFEGMEERQVVMSFDCFWDLPAYSENASFIPNIPKLNSWITTKVDGPARVEPHALGFLRRFGQTSLKYPFIRKIEVFSAIFHLFGIDAKQSEAGRITQRLIGQIGGISDCGVLRFKGVRRLFRRFDPLTPFNRNMAIGLIKNFEPTLQKQTFEDEAKQFSEIESAFRTPANVFEFLTERDVFRPGLKLRCPNCELHFWVSIDDIRSKIPCDLCGVIFKTVSTLRDQDWWFRRSGIFGRSDHQQGGIPVALTLLALASSEHRVIFTTGMNLSSDRTDVPTCETDFVYLAQDQNGSVMLGIGECKSDGGTIEQQDIEHLSAVTSQFDSSIHCFLVFAKTGQFTADELERFRLLRRSGNRVILLSESELCKPLRGKAKKSKNAIMVGDSLFDLADATDEDFLQISSQPSNPRRHNRRSKLDKGSLEMLRLLYESHNAPSGRLFEEENQCQCRDCKTFRGQR